MRFHNLGMSRSDRRWKRRDAAHRELPTTQRAAIPTLPVGRPEKARLVRCKPSPMNHIAIGLAPAIRAMQWR